ncbi:MAG TPA: alpha-hydroxy-acid oxidizing protein, partial [Candidatus Acidoferrum sp.]|nr:alpha-hydroxy-acid oxidizing protein [Candidatus Acidoferrum sp.]
MSNFGDFQLEIYFAALHGTLPRFPIRYEALEAKALQTLSPSLASYVAGGCGNERTQDLNVSAFDHWGIVPRMFRAATKRDLSV